MKTGKKSRFLALLLVAAMTVTLIPSGVLRALAETSEPVVKEQTAAEEKAEPSVSAVPEQDEKEKAAEPGEALTDPANEPNAVDPGTKAGATWTQIAWADITATDTIAITMSKGTSMWALPNAAATNANPSAVPVTLTDGKLTLAADSYGFKITQTTGGYHIMSGSNYLNCNNDANGSRIDTKVSVWTLDGNYLKSADKNNNTRWLGVYLDKPDWRAYKNTTGNTAGQTVSFWKLDDGSSGSSEDTTEAPSSSSEEPTSSSEDPGQTVSTIAEALAGADGASFTVKGVVTMVDGKNVFVQDVTGGICLFLPAADSSIKLGDTVTGTGSRATYRGLPELSSATVEKSEGLTLTAKSTTIGALTTSDVCTYVSLKKLEITEVNDNNGTYNNPNITLKDENDATIQIYKAVVDKTDGQWAFKVGDVVDVKCAVGINNTTLQLRNTQSGEITLHEDVVYDVPDGDYLVYNPKYKVALSSAYSGNYNAGVDMSGTVTDVTQTVQADPAIIWHVTNNEDGSIYISTYAGNHKLSMDTSYTSTPLDKVNDKWKLVKVNAEADDGLFFIENVGRTGYRLEWYASKNNFSAYNNNATSDLFQFNFVPAEPENSTPPTPDVTYLDKLTKAPANGGKVVIYNPGSSVALGTAANGSKLSPVSAALVDGRLPVSDGMALLTVTVSTDDAGTTLYQFGTDDSKYLTSGATGNSLSLAAITDATADYTKWTLEQQTDGTWIIVNYKAAYNNKSQAIEYYSGAFTTYGKGTSAAFKMDFYGDEHDVPDGDYLVYNPAYKMALSSSYTGNYNSGVDMTGLITDVTQTVEADPAIIWHVTNNDDGTIYISHGSDKLSMDTSYTSTPLNKANDKWKLVKVNPDADDGLYYIENVGRTGYRLEWYASKNNFSAYNNNATSDMFRFNFVPAVPKEGSGNGPLQAGDKVVIYNAEAEGVLGLDTAGLNTSLSNVATEIRNEVAFPENGAYVFTVGAEGNYFTFSAGGKYLATCNTEQLFMADELADTGENCGYWELEQKGSGYLIKSKTARYNNTGVVCIEFFSGAFSGWTFKASDQNIFIFSFYPVDESVNTLNDVTNDPKVVFEATEFPIKGQPYTVTFKLDDLTPLEQLTVNVTLNGEPVTNLENDGKNFSFIVPAEVTAVEDTLNVSVQVVNAAGGSYSGSKSLPVMDIPVFCNFIPEPGSKTGDDYMPLISVTVKNASDSDEATLTIGGETHPVQILGGVISYQPTEPLKEGRVTVKVEVVRADGVTGEKTWSFTVGEGGEQLYFGQLHSHTTYSDGSGSLETALDYIRNIPESANIQFVAFTDHSNYFDNQGGANPEGALYDMSLASDYSRNLWNSYKNTVAAFNADTANSDLIALAGFEMTWSGGPGHINTFNTPGIVSRNNTTLNNKTGDAGMKAYYALLSRTEGVDSLSQFNHPGKTFGNFTDFSYWDAVADSRIFTVEVGNGEGQIGAGGYYPSYEQYTMALDKGWHVAPTNNQDNHKGRWGNANDARDVILTDDFSEQGIYEAMRQMRIYATEDKNLEIYYTVNGQPLGSTISEVPEQLELNVQISDPDSSDSISKVEVIVNSGSVAYTWNDAVEIGSGNLSVTLAPDYSYYYIRVTEKDGDLAVTAPVWVGETLKLGISSFECGTKMPVTDEELTLTTTLFNSEAKAATVKSVVYTTNGAVVLGTDTTERTLPASGTLEIPFNYTPTEARVMQVTVTVVLEQDGKEYTFTKDLTLDVQAAEKLVYIGIDASHYNEYVAGNYKDSMGNFAALAANYAVRTVELKTSEDLIAACNNEKYRILIFTAPSRRLAAAQSDPRTYSAEELAAIKAFNDAGGVVIVAGWSDAYENYSVITGNPNIKHMAETQNDILSTLGSHLRIADDGTNDDSLNGGQSQRLYFSTYNMNNPLMEGIVVDPDHPNDRAYSEVFSQYGGASIYAEDDSGNTVSVLPATVDPAVYGHTSTYSKDSDNDGLGGSSVPKYAWSDNDNRLLTTACETLEGKGMIIVSGAAFMSNFEVQAAADTGSSDTDQQKNYANYKFCENIVKGLNEVEITPIAEVRAVTQEGYKFTIEGIVTSNASGYDTATAFFDCIYVQDETGGICCFPVAGNFKVGDKVRITGVTDFYQGEPELQVTTITKTGDGECPAPLEITAAAENDRSEEGMLVKVSGTITEVGIENGLIQTIYYKDDSGETARIFIDGYITTDSDVENCFAGNKVTAIGLASYDDTFNAPDGPFPRIRIRDRADVTVEKVDAFLVFNLGDGKLLDPNTGEYVTGEYVIKADNGDTIIIPDGPILDGWTFQYWRGSEYYPGDEYVVAGSHDFTAVYVMNETEGTTEADTTEANTTEADTTEADTTEANTTEADTTEADTTEANTGGADETTGANETTGAAGSSEETTSAGSGEPGSNSGGTVDTGDRTRTGFWLVMLLVSAAGMAFVVVKDRKTLKEN
ncbi:MAG: hypothetical protein IJK77_07015 [Lachnospiraceae bacterium]|nr:hypothetical protein [Lachnospiraceae bacterium]